MYKGTAGLRRMGALTCGFVVLTVLMSVLTGHAATYYVGKSGSNGNSCATAQSPTAGNRKLTIAGGAACLSTGDTLIIGNGTYVEAMNDIIPTGNSNTNRTTVRAENIRQVIVQPSSGARALTITGNRRKYITVDGLVFDGTSLSNNVVKFDGSVDDPQALAYAFPQFIRFQNNTVRNLTVPIISGFLLAAWLNLPGGDNEILNNIFSNIGNGNSAGLYVGQGRNVVRGNEFVNIHFCGITINKQNAAFPDDNIIQGNRLHNNQGQSIIINAGHRNLVFNNLIYNNTTNPTGGSGIVITDSGGDDNKLYNNTIYGNVGVGIDIRAAATNTIVKNNIVYKNGGHISDNGKNTVLDKNMITDPGFVNPGAGDFHLKPGSSAIDTGLDLRPVVTDDFDRNQRPLGPRYDVGAYEQSLSLDLVAPAPPQNVRVL